MANSFNNYFVNVGNNLAKQLPPAAGAPVVDDAAHRARHVFRLEPVSQGQVAQCVTEMRGNSAPGVDEFSAAVLKSHIRHILQPLTHIINLSLTTGIFPDIFKVAKVIPLFKSGKKSDFSNYRPISLVSVLAKVLEKCVKKQLQFFLENNKIISDCQYGFRKGKNSSDALFLVNKIIMNNINNNKKSIIVFVDLAKAFDSIDRNLLFLKLGFIGVQGGALEWFKSYLSARRQTVSILNQNSDIKEYEYGVVQGSILGPLLFLVYINNLEKVNLTGQLFMFADDTAIIFSGQNWDEVFQTASRDMSLIKKWFDQNVLTMNISKTKCLPIALRRGAEPPAGLRVVVHACGDTANTACACLAIERVDSYKYLGVVMDSQLRWEKHVTLIKIKIRKMIYVFYQLANILNGKEFKIVYCAYVQSVLQYGIIAWGEPLKI